MTYLRKFLFALIALLLAVAVLLWYLPVRWVMPWIAPQLHGMVLRQVHGSVWDGAADQVTSTDGHPLGRLQWQLSHRAVLGQLQARLVFRGPLVDFSGEVQRLSDGRIAWRDTHLRASLDAIPTQPGMTFGQPRGELEATITEAVLQGGWPVRLRARMQWLDATLRTAGGDVALGHLSGDAQAQDGPVLLHWQDDAHGPLQTAGQLQFSPLGWRLEATLRARNEDPALRQWLASLGPAASDGTVHIQSGGGLAGVPAAATEKGTP